MQQQWCLGVVTLAVIACNSKSSSTGSAGSAASPEQGSAAKPAPATGSGPGIDLNCVFDRLRDPHEAFHYVYKKDGDATNRVDQEADVSPQTIDGFRLQDDGTKQAIHAQHSDAKGWQAALVGLTGISGMASTIALVNHNSAMKREADAPSTVNATSATTNSSTRRTLRAWAGAANK